MNLNTVLLYNLIQQKQSLLNRKICFFSSSWNGFFNWTMTYRKDSDFPHPYGQVVKFLDHPTNKLELTNHIEKFGKDNSNLGEGKTKPVAWFVSNCNSMSKREDYVKELQKFIQASYLNSHSQQMYRNKFYYNDK